jgi:hypothetical protein
MNYTKCDCCGKLYEEDCFNKNNYHLYLYGKKELDLSLCKVCGESIDYGIKIFIDKNKKFNFRDLSRGSRIVGETVVDVPKEPEPPKGSLFKE